MVIQVHFRLVLVDVDIVECAVVIQLENIGNQLCGKAVSLQAEGLLQLVPGNGVGEHIGDIHRFREGHHTAGTVHRLTNVVDQIEYIADLGTVPGNLGHGHFLLTLRVLEIGVGHIGVIIGLVGACGHHFGRILITRRTLQVQEVAQCQLRGAQLIRRPHQHLGGCVVDEVGRGNDQVLTSGGGILASAAARIHFRRAIGIGAGHHVVGALTGGNEIVGDAISPHDGYAAVTLGFIGCPVVERSQHIRGEGWGGEGIGTIGAAVGGGGVIAAIGVGAQIQLQLGGGGAPVIVDNVAIAVLHSYQDIVQDLNVEFLFAARHLLNRGIGEIKNHGEGIGDLVLHLDILGGIQNGLGNILESTGQRTSRSIVIRDHVYRLHICCRLRSNSCQDICGQRFILGIRIQPGVSINALFGINTQAHREIGNTQFQFGLGCIKLILCAGGHHSVSSTDPFKDRSHMVTRICVRIGIVGILCNRIHAVIVTGGRTVGHKYAVLLITVAFRFLGFSKLVVGSLGNIRVICTVVSAIAVGTCIRIQRHRYRIRSRRNGAGSDHSIQQGIQLFFQCASIIAGERFFRNSLPFVGSSGAVQLNMTNIIFFEGIDNYAVAGQGSIRLQHQRLNKLFRSCYGNCFTST